MFLEWIIFQLFYKTRTIRNNNIMSRTRRVLAFPRYCASVITFKWINYPRYILWYRCISEEFIIKTRNGIKCLLLVCKVGSPLSLINYYTAIYDYNQRTIKTKKNEKISFIIYDTYYYHPRTYASAKEEIP